MAMGNKSRSAGDNTQWTTAVVSNMVKKVTKKKSGAEEMSDMVAAVGQIQCRVHAWKARTAWNTFVEVKVVLDVLQRIKAINQGFTELVFYLIFLSFFVVLTRMQKPIGEFHQLEQTLHGGFASVEPSYGHFYEAPSEIADIYDWIEAAVDKFYSNPQVEDEWTDYVVASNLDVHPDNLNDAICLRIFDWAAENGTKIASAPENANAYFLRGANQIASPLLISSNRRKQVACDATQAPDILTTGQSPACYAEERDTKSKYVTNPSSRSTFVDSFLQQMHSYDHTYLRNPYDYDKGAFIALIDLGKYGYPRIAADCTIKWLKDTDWLDQSTSEVNIKVLAQNQHIFGGKMWGHVQLNFLISQAGFYKNRLETNSGMVTPLHTIDQVDTKFAFLILLSICLLGYVGQVIHEIYMISWRIWFTNMWNIVDVIQSVGITVNIGLVIYLYILSNSFESDTQTTIDMLNLDELVKAISQVDLLIFWWYAQSLVVVASLVVAVVRVLEFLKFHERLSLVTETLARASSDLLHFLLVYAVLISIFVFTSMELFGTHFYRFTTFGNSLDTLLGFTLADDVLVHGEIGMLEGKGRTGVVLYFLIMFTNAIFMMNVLLSIVIDAFVEVKHHMHSSSPVWRDVGAIFRRRWECYKVGDVLWQTKAKRLRKEMRQLMYVKGTKRIRMTELEVRMKHLNFSPFFLKEILNMVHAELKLVPHPDMFDHFGSYKDVVQRFTKLQGSLEEHMKHSGTEGNVGRDLQRLTLALEKMQDSLSGITLSGVSQESKEDMEEKQKAAIKLQAISRGRRTRGENTRNNKSSNGSSRLLKGPSLSNMKKSGSTASLTGEGEDGTSVKKDRKRTFFKS